MELLPPAVLTDWLRAAGDPSRLRLLALCAEGAPSVSELAGALQQSEPRTSRHLKILCSAGLIERLRQGQHVHYRVSGVAAPASFVRGLLGLLDRADPLLQHDRNAARAASALSAPVAAESRLGRSLAALLAADAAADPAGDLLLIGVRHAELLEGAARAGSGCTLLAPSRRAAQWARAVAQRRGVACRVIEASSAQGFADSDLDRCGGPFARVVLDQPGSAAGLAQLLRRARGALVPAGRLWLFERYDALDSAGDRIVEHPLARLRRLLSDAGLQCEKITPVEADGEHVLAARARATQAAAGQHGAAGAA